MMVDRWVMPRRAAWYNRARGRAFGILAYGLVVFGLVGGSAIMLAGG